MVFCTLLTFLGLACTPPSPRTLGLEDTTLVTFGDSYTDQSRWRYFQDNSSYPPLYYQQVYPPTVRAADGGASWVRYAELYGPLSAHNYAISGATCSNLLTPRRVAGLPWLLGSLRPSVMDYQVEAYASDWVPEFGASPNATLDANNTYYSLWIGTNDVGRHCLLTDDQVPGVTIANVTGCAFEWMRTLYSYGARRFILQNMIPLQLTPAYSELPDPDGTVWPHRHNRTRYNIDMQDLVQTGNALWEQNLPSEISELSGAGAALFDSYGLFMDMYNDPGAFLNGSAPYNITGYYRHHGKNMPGSPDSYLWWDELHPSEQAFRIVAQQIVDTIAGTSAYATYFGTWS
ncbi:carbohydrate esterase family 16 protein [Calocera cornea HHB12733]|uniref:Carbohydrate esterase family 16 protein n=1 Tax=Calocera cornea HHB12733 TaxID=1353952 RepID=A0A165HRY1_9BASI|nr:carbohydrate esterase family 16 protein [Calocera cornea HHB12733]